MRRAAALALLLLLGCAVGPQQARTELAAVLEELQSAASEAAGGELPAPLAHRVAALSRALSPHGGAGLSAARGRLLLALLATQLDVSATVAACDFSSADLRGAALAGRDLRDRLGGVTFRAAYTNEDYLSGRHLFSAGLRGIDLRRADLSGADLHAADLSDARLRDAVLARADLRRAVLNRADLRGADLRGADLRGASLFEVDLRGAHLAGAELDGANLRGARLDAEQNR